MPKRVGVPCHHRGCVAIVDAAQRYCPTHSREASRHAFRHGADDAFYKSGNWRKLRDWHIAQQPLCQLCAQPGNVVDHVVPIQQGGERYAVANLQTLCHACHNRKRQQEQHDARRRAIAQRGTHES